jgi:hypothetical protein
VVAELRGDSIRAHAAVAWDANGPTPVSDVRQLPAIALDANGLPRNHRTACWAAQQELADFINELPESVYHLGQGDCELAIDRVIRRYLQQVKR